MKKKTCNNISSSQKVKENRNIAIFGDSRIKHLKVYEMLKKTGEYKVLVKNFRGVKTRCMKYHIKRTIREKSDHLILQVGKSNLR